MSRIRSKIVIFRALRPPIKQYSCYDYYHRRARVGLIRFRFAYFEHIVARKTINYHFLWYITIVLLYNVIFNNNIRRNGKIYNAGI